MTTRETFKPPPVLPAQAPMNISRISSHFEYWGHKLKSTVPKPVVLMMVETLKKAWRRAVVKLPYILEIFTAMVNTENSTMAKNQRSSSFFSTSFTRPMSSR